MKPYTHPALTSLVILALSCVSYSAPLTEEFRELVNDRDIARSSEFEGGTLSGPVFIESMACDVDGICTVGIASVIGPDDCKRSYVSWDKVNTVSGQMAFVFFSSAYAMGSPVSMHISDECLNDYPTFSFVSLHKQTD